MILDGNPGTAPVARATEVPTQLYFWLLIQLCSHNNFSRYWMIPWSTRNMKISPFDAEKICASSIKSPNHIIFSEHKRLSPFPILFPLLQWYVMSIVILCTSAVFFFYCGLRIGSNIWCGGSEGSDALLFSLISLPVGHFCHRILSCPSLLWKLVVYSPRCVSSAQKNIFWKEFWGNLSKLGPFLNLKLG